MRTIAEKKQSIDIATPILQQAAHQQQQQANAAASMLPTMAVYPYPQGLIYNHMISNPAADHFQQVWAVQRTPNWASSGARLSTSHRSHKFISNPVSLECYYINKACNNQTAECQCRTVIVLKKVCEFPLLVKICFWNGFRYSGLQFFSKQVFKIFKCICILYCALT